MTMRPTTRPFISTKRSNTTLPLGYLEILWNQAIQTVPLPWWNRPDLTMMERSTPSCGTGRPISKKVYREEKGLRLESINPAYDDLFVPLRRWTKKSSVSWLATSSLWRSRHAFLIIHVSQGLILLLWIWKVSMPAVSVSASASILWRRLFVSWVGATILLASS